MAPAGPHPNAVKSGPLKSPTSAPPDRGGEVPRDPEVRRLTGRASTGLASGK